MKHCMSIDASPSGACRKFDNTFLRHRRHSCVKKTRRRPCYACVFSPCSDACGCEKFVTELSARPTRVIQLLMALILTAISQQIGAQQGADCLMCHTGLPATEFNVIPEETTEQAQAGCDYSFAADFDGWGWNAIAGESCPPLATPDTSQQSASTCDYSNAGLYDGWGWDPVNRASCSPQQSDDPHARFPVCSATLYDADEDGFGWEDNATCIVTSDSTAAPVFTNRQTGNQVDLVRAYWDGNTDLANKVVQCDLYYFDSYSMIYRTEDFPFRSGAGINNQVFPSYRFHHLALPPEPPYRGWIRDVSIIDNGEPIPTPLTTDPYWTTDDGRYIGPTLLQEPYLELITRNNGVKAIRAWVNSRQDTALDLYNTGNRVRRDGYFECYDINGRDFQPSGVVGGGTTSPTVKADLVFTTEPSPSQPELPAIQDPLTGEPVVLEKAYWDYNKDLAGRQALCLTFRFDERGLPNAYDPVGAYEFPFHYVNSGTRIHYRDFGGPSPGRAGSFIVEDGVLRNPDGSDLYDSVLFSSDYVQMLEEGIRIWRSPDEFKWCYNTQPTGSAPEVTDNNQCVYSNANQYDGWGWNPVTRTSCPPLAPVVDSAPNTELSGCDYNNVGDGGWGWNPTTRTSCPPLPQSAGTTNSGLDNCDYSNAGADGWGWNPVTLVSCRPR